MQFNDEKDYIMRMIKEAVSVLFSVMFGKNYVQVELEKGNRFAVSGRRLDEYKEMVDRGEINEAENMMLEDINYTNKDEVAAAILFYRYLSQKGEEFLRNSHYSKEEALDGLKTLAEKAGYQGIVNYEKEI
ncbi:DUF6483 family protein [Roseburia hominis]